MNARRTLPSYETLFGELDFKKGEDARSVYSPAAYLTDLLQLTEDHFSQPAAGTAESESHLALDARRADIKQLILNGDNTFGQTPYLDIVNDLLRRRIAAPLPPQAAFERLKTAAYPFNLPLDYDYERLKKYLRFLNVSEDEVQDLFSLTVDLKQRARTLLGLSQQEADYFLRDRSSDEEAVGAAFHLTIVADGQGQGADLNARLAPVAHFLLTTALTGAELRTLLFQNLSATAMNAAGDPERIRARDFFINHGLGGYAALDAEEAKLIWLPDEPVATALPATIPLAWFDRCDRLIRLARKIGLSFVDLDLILRNCCRTQLDDTALQVIALIKRWQTRYELPIEVICALFSPVNTLGIGDADEPADLLNRTFNHSFADLEQKYLSLSSFIPPTYAHKIGNAAHHQLTLAADLLADESAALRKRLQKALQITEAELRFIIGQFRERERLTPDYISSLHSNLTLAGLSLIFRIVTLVDLLDITLRDLFDLFDLLEFDPAIRTANPFKLLFPFPGAAHDCYRLIDQPNQDITASLWLVQVLAAMVDWLNQHDFTTADLKFIQMGSYPDATLAAQAQQETLDRLNQTVQAFLPVALRMEAFVSPPFDARSAHVIYETLLSHRPSIVSASDRRVLRFDAAVAATIADAALGRLATLSPADFRGIGLADKLNDKLYQNLIIHGFLSATGEINAHKVAEKPMGGSFVSDFSAYQADLFAIIHDLYMAERATLLAAGGEGQVPDELDLTLSLFLSDLAPLALPHAQLLELYDNLIFNGYLDAEGQIADAAFFADFDNAPALTVNTILQQAHTQLVFTFLQQQIADYESAPYLLRATIFQESGLTEREVQTLIENLQFNDWIDEALTYRNKQSLLTLPLKDFKVALPFYPYRKPLLAAIQADLATDKSRYFMLSKEALAPVAEEIAAALCFAQLHVQYLVAGQISEAWRAFFAAPENSAHFTLGSYFTPALAQAVFTQIHTVQQHANSYRLQEQALAALGLYAEEIQNLLARLLAAGFIDPTGVIPRAHRDYFLHINNALDFRVVDYDDFNQEIFFALHAVARATQDAHDAIVGTLAALANEQETAVFDSLAEGFEIDRAILHTIVDYLFHQPPYKTEAVIIPLLAAADQADQNGKLTQLPAQQGFGSLLQRITQFVHLAQLLRLSPAEIAVIFQDQNLAAKFPENLVLPAGVTRFDALLAGLDDKIYLFNGDHYYTYSAATYELTDAARPLTTLSPRFAALTHIDAAFIDPLGHAWLMAGTHYFMREKGSDTWQAVTRRWGKIQSSFTDPDHIQAAFTNQEGVAYLFASEQYARYTDATFAFVDPGFPRKIAGNWAQEQQMAQLPPAFTDAIDAAFADADGQIYLFQGSQFIRQGADEIATPVAIDTVWGKVNNNFANLSGLDAAFSHDGYLYLFLGDQVIRYADHIENKDVTLDEGFPQRISTLIRDLPDDFADGIDAIFAGVDGHIHLCKHNRTLQVAQVGAEWRVQGAARELSEQWGRIKNNIQSTGLVDAAFTGLDGCTYLFSGDQYVRYSGRDYAKVDEGYPRTIAGDWGGLAAVTAAFVLDGKSYLFAKGKAEYVCYSTNDYTTPDPGFPKPIDQEQWWNLPASLVAAGFSEPDAVLIGLDQHWYLFKDAHFVAFDHLHRWWSEPKPLASKWNDLPFTKIDAAFTGRDGKSYLFSGDQFVRYTDPSYNRVDDRYPRAIKSYWGQVVNQIERSRRIDAALVVESQVTTIDADGKEVLETIQHTYLFSGNQYFRYAGDNYAFVEEGYPRTIQTALHTEPRFKNLTAPLRAPLDAAFADRRHLYLVQGDTLQIVADAASRRYDDIALAPTAAFIDEGSLFIAQQSGWRQVNNLEMAPVQQEAALPLALRRAPATWQTGLSAVLHGTDGNTYLFQGERCYNWLLQRSYPSREEWGIVYNRITAENQVDAAFVGLDGRTYLFSGEQFVSYLPNAAVDVGHTQCFIDGLPRPIADHWGGLTHVQIAFAREGRTYLLEKPDEFGQFRYVTYTGADYAKPDTPAPQSANFDWWEIPHVYQEEGFQRVDAVLTDDENIFLIQGQEFIQYNRTNDLWTYAKPLDRVWRGLEFDTTTFPSLVTALLGSDGNVYFFAANSFVSVAHAVDNPHPAGPPAPRRKIRDHWGLMDNDFTNRGLVDAAFVWDERETYLFAGDHYVKYTGRDYRYVDAGYPKRIVESLRTEAIFRHLPDTFETDMQALLDSGQGLSATVANKGSIYLFVGQHLYAVSPQVARTCTIAQLGRLKNRIAQRQKIDAALVNDRHQLLLFAGDQLFRYSENDFTVVDEGYPQKIGTFLAREAGFAALDPTFTYDLDAVLQAADAERTLYLFKGKEYVGSDAPTQKKPVKAFWGRVRNNFTPHGDETNLVIDAVLVAPDGKSYLFKGDQCIRYSDFANEHVDEGYPLPLKAQWENLPAAFADGIDGGFVFEGKTYLLNNGDYVRYSRPHYHAVDNIYPQPLAHRWRKWGDYLLGDIRLISLYKRLQDEYSSGAHTLTDFLNSNAGAQATPYVTLQAIFGWDAAEIRWLKRHNAFLPITDPHEQRFNLELIEKMDQVFGVAQRLGADPSAIYTELWQQLYDPNRSPNLPVAADQLYRYLSSKQSAQDWAILKAQIHDELNLLQRDLWVQLAIAQDPTLTRPKDLYDRLLIDVAMGSAARTSRVQEAIAAIQLYFHRYLVNLEPIALASGGDHPTREQLKQRWQWLKNYRGWEANRKVFLYPENYLRPELRDTKTPEFRQLEERLLQGELNAEAAEAAFTSYLEAFSTIGNLKIAGAHVYAEGAEKVLLLCGHTRLAPREFYYRTVRFTKAAAPTAAAAGSATQPPLADLVVWGPWEKVNVSIAADRVFPLVAHGRLMLFWIEIKDIEEPEAKFRSKLAEKPADTKSETVAETVSEVNMAQKKLRHEAQVNFTLRQHDKHWTPPQPLKSQIQLDYEIDAAYCEGDQIVTFAGAYCLKSTQANPDGEIKRIEEFAEFQDLPESFQSGIDAATTFRGKRYLFKGGQYIIQANSHTTSGAVRDLIELPEQRQFLLVGPGTFHVDHLIKKSNQTEEPAIYKGVAAAFDLSDDILALVDTEGNYSFYTEADGKLHPVFDVAIMRKQLPFFARMIGVLVTRGGNFRPADAVFKKEGIFYVLRDGQYECYDDVGTELLPLDGFPKPIRGNLSFNMDKFFNKLHLTLAGDAIHISYMSPKDQVLLYGKLKPDFTFEETPLQDDPALRLVLTWQHFVRAHLYNEGGYLTPSIVTQISALISALTEIQAQLGVVTTVHTNNERLGEALTVAQALLSSEDNDDDDGSKRDKAGATDGAKAKLAQLLAAIQSELQPLTGEPRLQESINALLALVKKLGEAMDKVYQAKEQQKPNLKKQAAKVVEEGAALQDQVRTAVKTATAEIRAMVEQRRDALSHLNNGDLGIDVTHHQQASASFAAFLQRMRQILEVWGVNLPVAEELALVQRAQTAHLQPLLEHNSNILVKANAALAILGNITDRTSPPTMTARLADALAQVSQIATHLSERLNHLHTLNHTRWTLLGKGSQLARHAREALLGTFDLFPAHFGIATTTNFVFSEPGRPDWYCFEAKGGTFLCRPLTDDADSTYEIIRLTTTVIPRLSAILFTQGITGFLGLHTQQEDEMPAFGNQAEAIRFTPVPFTQSGQLFVPGSANLDFYGAGGIYYAELFFHAPLLIAQMLNAAQKFEEAKRWYEFIFDPIFDPIAVGSPWRYLPFTTATPEGTFFIDRNQIKRYLDDPFDPHAIAALRPSAYRKAVVMRYIDNLLDWGDMLFRQYTRESINEARLLYTLASDLLGDKPENLGALILSPEKPVADLVNTPDYDFVVQTAGAPPAGALTGQEAITIIPGTPNDSVGRRYFFVPENEVLQEYWQRVDDRLYKIRASLNMEGQAQPLLLFEPPLDPMALVQAVAHGATLGQLLTNAAVAVPPYRFEFLAYRAQNLLQKLNQYGGELLATLEKKDAEALNLLQTQQEAQILNLTINIREAQIKEAEQNILQLEESRRHAQERIALYQGWLDAGMLPEELHQINLMIAASAAHYTSSVTKLIAMFTSQGPDALVGPFIMGIKLGGSNLGDSIRSFGEVAESLGEGLSVTGEVLATQAQIKHMFEDWDVQLMIAKSDDKQLSHQLEGARLQKLIADYELAVLRKQIDHNQAIQRFMREKFTNQELYQWLAGKLAGLYFQSYQLAFDLARMAERAFQFERGLEEQEVRFIQGGYWDSRRKGLLSGEQLALDLDRMEQAFITTNEHRLEISKEVSLLALDPLAFVRLKQHGVCEFSLDEAFFDYDFPGHYCRQVKTMAVAFDVPEGVTVNATLTQLNHQTVLKPDPKAVKYLLQPRDALPTTLRSNWRSNQQIVLSHHDQYEKNNGMFELRYDSDRYLPFEGTGAVSRWKLELNGKPGALDRRTLLDVTVNIKYTARHGGTGFAEAVKGILKPYQAARFFDMTYDFADAWNDFLDGDGDVLVLPLTRDHFPNMSSSKISGIFAHYDLVAAGRAGLILNDAPDWELHHNAYLETPGLNIGARGSELRFTYRGDKANLRNLQLIFRYKAAVK